MIKMKIIRGLVLVIFFYTPLNALDFSGEKNPVICTIAGSSYPSTYVFNISELPERCNIITVGQYSFDLDDGTNLFVMESDKSIIKTLVRAKKPTYIHIGFESVGCDWTTIFDPSNEIEFKKNTFDPFINFISKFDISGIIINCPPIYYNMYIEGFSKNVSSFVTKVKNITQNLKVGFFIPGFYYESFTNETLFDFTITNKVLDFYVIEWGINNCTNDTLKTGFSPIKSTNPDLITVEQVTSGINKSTMDKSKIYDKILIAPIIPLYLLSKNDDYYVITYTKYCNNTDPFKPSELCITPSILSYQQGAYAKTVYVGIVLEQLDTDDYEGQCQCEKFPVTNLIIDGWTGKTFETCPKLDRS